ncbi:multivesicular body sorting factor 12 [Monosporozyma servazzii]
MSHDQGVNYKDVLRKIPLYNRYGSTYPQGLPPKITLESIIPANFKTQPLPPIDDMFQPWIEECNELIEECNEYKMQPKQFEQFYFKEYLSKKPPSLLDPQILSPLKTRVSKDNSTSE